VGSDVLGCLLVTSAAVAVLCAVPTMVRVAQLGAGGALKGDARGVTRGLRATHLSAVLVSVQVALAVVLLAGAGVLAQSLLRIVSADTGVRSPEQLLVGTLRMAPDTYASPDATQAYFRRLQDELRTISGIESFALTTALPGIGWGPERAFQVEGQASGSERIPSVNVLTAGTDYFEVLGRAMTAGRGFASRDDANGLAVAIVNERFVETVLQGEQGVGRRVRLVSGNVPGPWMTIVGVAPNIKQADPTRQQFKPLLYVPFASQRAPRGVNIAGTRAFRGANLLVRTSMTAEQAASLVRTGVRRIDADVTLEELAPFRSTLGFNRDLTDLAHAELGKHAAIAPTYALVALLLAGVGLYAVIAHSVGQRTQEIGVRVVVGASARDIRRLILAEGLRPVTYGLAAGLVISLGANGLLRSQLVGVSPYDLPTLMVAPALLLLVAVVACHIPARRALRVEPAVALRQD
ncbi:MAG: FtsX-like permease family protein, partial [Vicinamibacterales bacterium]